MRHCVAPIITACSLAFCVHVSSAAESSTIAPPVNASRAAIQAAYDQFSAAFDAHDLDRFMSFFSSDYTSTDPKGKPVSRDQTIKQFKEKRDQILTMRCQYAIQNLSQTADGVLVEMKMHSDGTGQKRVMFMKVRGTFTNDTIVRDLWVNTADGWRLKRRQTLQDDTRINGV